jgi:hypothetical protein
MHWLTIMRRDRAAHPPVLTYSISLKAIQPASSKKPREARKQPSTPSALLSCQFLMVRGLYGRTAFWGGYGMSRSQVLINRPVVSAFGQTGRRADIGEMTDSDLTGHRP